MRKMRTDNTRGEERGGGGSRGGRIST